MIPTVFRASRYKKRDLCYRNRLARNANRLPLKGGNLLLSGAVLAIHLLDALGGSIHHICNLNGVYMQFVVKRT